MLWTIFVILLVLWLLGLVSSYTLGGFIHILLVLAIVVLVINLLSGRRTAVYDARFASSTSKPAGGRGSSILDSSAGAASHGGAVSTIYRPPGGLGGVAASSCS